MACKKDVRTVAPFIQRRTGNTEEYNGISVSIADTFSLPGADRKGCKKLFSMPTFITEAH